MDKIPVVITISLFFLLVLSGCLSSPENQPDGTVSFTQLNNSNNTYSIEVRVVSLLEADYVEIRIMSGDDPVKSRILHKEDTVVEFTNLSRSDRLEAVFWRNDTSSVRQEYIVTETR